MEAEGNEEEERRKFGGKAQELLVKYKEIKGRKWKPKVL